MPFTSILYANGPGYVHINGTRGNITMVDYCKYKLMCFRCDTRLCWCVYRQRELMWLPLTHACVFLWAAKMKYGVYGIPCAVFCSLCTGLAVAALKKKSYLYFFVEHWTAMIQFLPHLFCTIRFSHCMSVYTWRWKYKYPGMNYLLKPPILSFWTAWFHFMFSEPVVVSQKCTLNPSGTLSKHAITSEEFTSKSLCIHLEKYEALQKSVSIFCWGLCGQNTIATFIEK